MNITTQCTLALQLAENADEISDPNRFLLLLQQCFVVVFKGDAVLGGSPQTRSVSPRDIASREEEKLMLVRAIQAFHTKGKSRHGSFFRSPEYHNHAALFIHELLNSLSGNSKDWFRELQFHSLLACQSIITVLSPESVRNCLPGVVSAAVRYMKRAHHGKDCVVVRLSAIDLLHQCLREAFSTAAEPQWVRKASVHLSRSLGAVLSPAALIQCHYDGKAMVRCRVLVQELLTASALSIDEDSALFRELVGGFLVLENMCHLHTLGVAEELPSEEESKEPKTRNAEDKNKEQMQSTLPNYSALEGVFKSPLARQFVVDTLRELRGVPLLHAVTTVVRLPYLRPILIGCRDDDAEQIGGADLFTGIVQKCIRLVGVEMSPSDLYTYRQPRRFPAGVVDECLETIAHALAEIPYIDDDGAVSSSSTAGEQMTNALLTDARDVLADWDLYVLHPATVYVVSRLIVWQFKPIPSYLEEAFSKARSQFPYPTDFISCNVLEQLWSAIGQQHLWCIEEDEDLCSAQQTAHRRVMASIIIRVLEIIALDVVEPATHMSAQGTATNDNNDSMQDGLTFEDIEAGRISFERLCAITLYSIMEKAAIPGAVHDTVMHCLDSFAVVSGEIAPLGFFTRVSDYIVDEASRAVKETYLRTKVTSVLRGTIKFLAHQVMVEKPGPSDARQPSEDGEQESSHFLFSATSSVALPQLVRHRLSPVAVRAALCRIRVDDLYITKCADFVSVVVAITTSAAKEALEEGDDAGSKSLLTLLRDALDIAMLLTYSAPLEVLKEEDERETTSANLAVKKLQCHVMNALRTFQTHALRSQAAVSVGVEVVLRGLTTFLSSSTAIKSVGFPPRTTAKESVKDGTPPAESTSDSLEALKKTEEEEEEEEEEQIEPSLFRLRPPKQVPWFAVNQNGEVTSSILLPRTIMPMVYQTYVPLLSLIKEPVAQFVTTASTIGERSRVEQRHLMETRINDSFSAALTGLHSLLLLAVEFLQHRYITEVLPVVLVWYERTLLPTIPTPSELRARKQVRDFFDILCVHCDQRESVAEWSALVDQSVSLFHAKRSLAAKKVISIQASTASTQSNQHADQEDVVHLTRDDLYIGGSAPKPPSFSASSPTPRNAVSQLL